MILHDCNEFLDLSRELSYALEKKVEPFRSALSIILNGQEVGHEDQEILLAVLAYLDRVYLDKRRRLGPPAVLHPLRATALLVRAHPEVSLLDLLTELLHDRLEDITRHDFDAQTWDDLDSQYRSTLKRLTNQDEWFLVERVDALTRRGEEETYYQYMGRLLQRSRQTPELVRIKLADRLDNILDVRVDRQRGDDVERFFPTLFQLLFAPHSVGFVSNGAHPSREGMDNARRLYELFKNTVVLSMVRLHDAISDDETAQLLFNSIARAGVLEAQRIATHVLTYHIEGAQHQRCLVQETMEYCRTGRLEVVTTSRGGARLDGLFQERFDAPTSRQRQEKLGELKADFELMSAAALAFVIIFQCFLDNQSFYVHGITPEGILAEDVSITDG